MYFIFSFYSCHLVSATHCYYRKKLLAISPEKLRYRAIFSIPLYPDQLPGLYLITFVTFGCAFLPHIFFPMMLRRQPLLFTPNPVKSLANPCFCPVSPFFHSKPASHRMLIDEQEHNRRYDQGKES